MAPDVVIIDRDNDDQGLVRALLNHGLSLVEVDANENTVTLLNGRRVPISEIGDMVRVISESKLVNVGRGHRGTERRRGPGADTAEPMSVRSRSKTTSEFEPLFTRDSQEKGGSYF